MSPLRVLAVAGALGVATWSAAVEIPGRPSGRVSDWAGKISPQAHARIEAGLAGHEAATGAQVAVAIFPGLDGQDADDFTNRLVERWKLGRAGVDDGVLLAVYVTDRRARIEVGYGLEDKLTDALSRRILETQLFPRLRDGDWDGAIEGSVEAILAVARGETLPAPARRARRGGAGRDPIIVLVIVVALIAVLFVVFALRGVSVYTRSGRRRVVRAGNVFWGGGPWSGGGGSGTGGGMSGGGGGGFSGGGGMSGGGGASGSW